MGWCTKVRKSLVKGIDFWIFANSSEPNRSNQYNGSCNILCNVFWTVYGCSLWFFLPSQTWVFLWGEVANITFAWGIQVGVFASGFRVENRRFLCWPFEAWSFPPFFLGGVWWFLSPWVSFFFQRKSNQKTPVTSLFSIMIFRFFSVQFLGDDHFF